MDGLNYVRSKEDIELILHHSKVDRNKLLPQTQVLYYCKNPLVTKIIELPDAMVDSLKLKKSWWFQGNSYEKAMLCTDSETYAVKEVETSNSLLLINGLQYPDDLSNVSGTSIERKEIIGSHNSYLEIVLVKPRIGFLRSLLNQRKFNGIELEPESYCSNEGYYNFETLLEIVQVSEAELEVGLKEIDAFEFAGFWRVMGFDYLYKSVSYILNYVEENSWVYNCIPMGPCLNVLRELLPKVIAEHIFGLFMFTNGAYDDEKEELICELKPSKICRLQAEALLRSVGSINLDDFLITWSQSVPEEMEVSLEMIKDLVLIDELPSGSSSIRYFPEYELSDDPQERFSQLFKVREKWNYEQIAPFLKKVETHNQNIKAFLSDHTRSAIVNNTVYYSARHAK